MLSIMKSSGVDIFRECSEGNLRYIWTFWELQGVAGSQTVCLGTFLLDIFCGLG